VTKTYHKLLTKSNKTLVIVTETVLEPLRYSICANRQLQMTSSVEEEHCVNAKFYFQQAAQSTTSSPRTNQRCW